MNHDENFCRQRDETYERVIALIDGHIKTAAPSLIASFDELSAESLRRSAEKESWSLFLEGVKHLKEGAPDKQPGSMTNALSRMSLRSGAFAAALGVRPPQFEQKYFSVKFTTGHEAALFFCSRLVEAAAGDLSKSRQIILQKMQQDKPDGAFGSEVDALALRRQMIFSFNVLAATYGQACEDLKSALADIPPPAPPSARPKPRKGNFDF